MAKTKEQRAAAHRCQLERNARKRQRRNLLESTQQRTVAHMSSVEPSGRSQALPRKQTMQLLESNEGEIFFPSAKSEEGGETVRQEMHVRSTGEEESTQCVKEPAASLAQGAEGKLEEPNAALVEIISDGVATTYELPISSDSMEFLESDEGNLFFLIAKSEEGGETDGQEIHDISTGEEESTQGKRKPAASLAQAAEGKLEEPNAALVEMISDGEATTDKLPISSESSGDEDDEEVCLAVEELSNSSVIGLFEEKGHADICVVCADSGLLLDETCPLCEKGEEADVQEIHYISTGEEECTQGMREPAASLVQVAEDQLEEPNAALVEIISDGGATADELPISSDSMEFLESDEGNLFFLIAKSEEGGETDGQEIHDISTGEKESTQGKRKPAASLAQAAEGKLEEPNAALVEIISDGEATTDELPISSESSGDEDDEEVCLAVEELSNSSVIGLFEEKGHADICVVCADSGLLLDETCPLCEKGEEADMQEIHYISTGEEECTQGMREPAASLVQVAEDQLEEPNAALVEIISDGGATADELPISSDSMEFLESDEGNLFFLIAKSEEGGETGGHEIYDISTVEKESTQGKRKPTASLAQAAEGKLEEPNAALVEIISDGEATIDELPISSESSGDEDDEEVCLAVEELSNSSVIGLFAEKGHADICVVCTSSGLLLDETCPLCNEFELERRNAAVQFFTSKSDAAMDEPQVMSSRCNCDIDDLESTGAVELPSSLSAELDQVVRNLSAHMNSLTECVRIHQVPSEVEFVDLDSQDPAYEISILARSHVEESHNSVVPSAIQAYGTAYEAAVRLHMPAAALHEAGKVKLKIHDLNGAIRNFSEAKAIHRQMGTLKTLAGAHLLLDIGVANLVSGEIDDALEACVGICEFAGVLRTPASMQFLHEVVSLPCPCGTLDGVHKTLAAAYTFMENVHKSEFDTFVNRWSQILRSPIGRFFGECS